LAIVEKLMNTPWAICIAREHGLSLAALRLGIGIEVGEDGHQLWLRGRHCDESLERKLSALPASGRYEWLLPMQIRMLSQRIPAGALPNLQWQPLDGWLRVEIPASALPANLPATIPLRLVRSACERDPELLLTRVDELARFAASAAQVRLSSLQFAVEANGAVLVRGQPLPPLPGQRFVLHGSVAVPAGFAWEPAVDASVLARRFGVSGDALVVWNEDGSITRLHSEQFVPLTRSALRATQQALAEAP
jgi:hypothetical protein